MLRVSSHDKTQKSKPIVFKNKFCMKNDFVERIKILEYYDILSIYKNHRLVELNNVIEGFKSNFFTIVFQEENNIDEYSLIYIGNYDKLKGLVLKSGRKSTDRDLATFAFSKAVEDEFPEMNSITVFNTFQSMVKQTFESFGILCIPEYLANFSGEMTFILPNKPKSDVDYILEIDPIQFYRSFFDGHIKLSDENGISKVYLMVEGKEGFIKIGETQKKLNLRRRGVAEPTLMATEPIIKVISAWKAPKEIERELHLKYRLKRKRGEWFDLRLNDLIEINEFMSTYGIIEIESHKN